MGPRVEERACKEISGLYGLCLAGVCKHQLTHLLRGLQRVCMCGFCSVLFQPYACGWSPATALHLSEEELCCTLSAVLLIWGNTSPAYSSWHKGSWSQRLYGARSRRDSAHINATAGDGCKLSWMHWSDLPRSERSLYPSTASVDIALLGKPEPIIDTLHDLPIRASPSGVEALTSHRPPSTFKHTSFKYMPPLLAMNIAGAAISSGLPERPDG